MISASDFTQVVIDSINSFKSAMVGELLDIEIFSLSPDTLFFQVIVIAVIGLELADIMVKSVEANTPDTKRIWEFFVYMLLVMVAYGNINPNNVPVLNLYSSLDAKYQYSSSKPDGIRHVYSISTAFFDSLGSQLKERVESEGDTLTQNSKFKALASIYCDGQVDKDSCYKTVNQKSYEDLEKEVFTNECSSTTPQAMCDISNAIDHAKVYLTFQGLMVMMLGILAWVKVLFIALVYLLFTLTVVIALFLFKAISIFLIHSKTRGMIVSSFRFVLSTSAFNFTLALVRFIMFTFATTIASVAADSEAGLTTYIIAAIFAFVVLVSEIGLLWFIPELNNKIFNLQLDGLVKLGDQMKSTLQTTVGLVSGVVTAGATAAGAVALNSKFGAAKVGSATANGTSNLAGKFKRKVAGQGGSDNGGTTGSNFSSGGGGNGPFGGGGGSSSSTTSSSLNNGEGSSSNGGNKTFNANAPIDPAIKDKLDSMAKRNAKAELSKSKSSLNQEVDSGSGESSSKSTINAANDIANKAASEQRVASGSGNSSARGEAEELLNKMRAKKAQANASGSGNNSGGNYNSNGGRGQKKQGGMLNAIGRFGAMGLKGAQVAADVIASGESLSGTSSLVNKGAGVSRDKMQNAYERETQRIEQKRFGGDRKDFELNGNEKSELYSEKEELMSNEQEFQALSDSYSLNQKSAEALTDEIFSMDANDPELQKKEMELRQLQEVIENQNDLIKESESGLNSKKERYLQSLKELNISNENYNQVKKMMDDGVLDESEIEILKERLGDKNAKKIIKKFSNVSKNLNNLADRDLMKFGKVTNQTIQKISKGQKYLTNEELASLNEKIRVNHRK